MPNARKKKAAKMEDFKVTKKKEEHTFIMKILLTLHSIFFFLEKEAQGRQAKNCAR
jgi:hypothetical protein